MTLVTGERWTVKVWKSCGPWPTVSGCCTITRTTPVLVPYAISIQFPHSDVCYNTVNIPALDLCENMTMFTAGCQLK